MLRNKWGVLLGLVVLAGLADPVAAFLGGPSGDVSGTVFSAVGGTPLAGVTVIASQGGVPVQTVTSNGAGAYALQHLVVGTYDILASKFGFEAVTRSGVVVLKRETTTVDISLVDHGPYATTSTLYGAVDLGVTSGWTTPENATDGLDATFAEANQAGAVLRVVLGRTLRDLGPIISVAIGVAHRAELADGNDGLSLTPIFTGGAGVTSPVLPAATGVSQDWLDITADPKGPGVGNWTWADVQGLSVDVVAKFVGKAAVQVWQVDQVYVRVTHEADTTPPTAPPNVAITDIQETSLRLSWEAATDNIGVAGYQVTYGDGTPVATTTALEYTDDDLSAATTYSYYVTAVDDAGNESAQSNLVSATTLAPDTDQDGVRDDVDLCPDTPVEEPVGGDGCSPSQLDSDGDGVSDAEDVCPGTAEGETVDLVGCAESQRDDDGDGVSNGVDLCPRTEAGEAVDGLGCSHNQWLVDSDVDSFADILELLVGTNPHDDDSAPAEKILYKYDVRGEVINSEVILFGSMQ